MHALLKQLRVRRCSVGHAPNDIQGHLHKAVEHYHKALGLRPDDTLTTDLLGMAVNGLEAQEAAALAAQDDQDAME